MNRVEKYRAELRQRCRRTHVDSRFCILAGMRTCSCIRSESGATRTTHVSRLRLAIVYVLILAACTIIVPAIFSVYIQIYLFSSSSYSFRLDSLLFPASLPLLSFLFSTLLPAICSPLSYRLYPFSPFFFFVHCSLPSLKLDCRHYRHHHHRYFLLSFTSRIFPSHVKFLSVFTFLSLFNYLFSRVIIVHSINKNKCPLIYKKLI